MDDRMEQARRSQLLALFHTRYFGGPVATDRIHAQADAVWTSDRKQLSRADVVIFHLPDFPFRRRVKKYPGQLWVGWSQESAVHFPHQAHTEFMQRFDITMSHAQTADVWAPYLPKRAVWKQILAAPAAIRQEAAGVAMFASAGVDRSGRLPLLAELMRHVRVDSYGKLFNNRTLAEPDLGPATKIATLARYPFAIAFENAIEPDYVTEKIFEALLAGAIPVYLGAPNIADLVPAECYVDASAYAGGRQLGTYLNYLVANPDAAARYHRWRSQPLPVRLLERAHKIEREPFLRLIDLCEKRRGGALPRRFEHPLARLRNDVLHIIRGWADAD